MPSSPRWSASCSACPALVPFVILGTVIPDADILYGRLFTGNPRFYLLTHGGCAHSITGAIGISLLAVAEVQLAGLCGILPPGIPVATLVPAVLAGAILHIATDALAFPGIPLLFPFSDRKITLGILPGPSSFSSVSRQSSCSRRCLAP